MFKVYGYTFKTELNDLRKNHIFEKIILFQCMNFR